MSASMEIECRAINNSFDPFLDQVEKTYNDSFPEVERRAFSLVRKLIKEDARFVLYLLLRDCSYMGFITAWHFEKFTYVEHFAIDAAARNGGIGGESMRQFLTVCNAPVVLEVETPVEEMSKRRIGFYERLGYVLDDRVYFQPPYRPGESALEMRLMTYGAIDLNHSFEEVKECLYRNVYGCYCDI